jgi:fatty acid synthase subunit alpha
MPFTSMPLLIFVSGTDLRECNESLTRSLCDQIFTQPIHWTTATAFPETATHVVDFGPGGLSGIGSLTARNMEGRGIRTIIIGEKGKGASELYRVAGVSYEAWWNKTFAPRLVKTA